MLFSSRILIYINFIQTNIILILFTVFDVCFVQYGAYFVT